MSGGNQNPTSLEAISSDEGRAKLKRLIAFLRAEGVSAFASGDLTLSLSPQVEFFDEPGAAPKVEDPPRKKDGLTPAQQLDLYGQEMS